jgi:hypothetical protein
LLFLLLIFPLLQRASLLLQSKSAHHVDYSIQIRLLVQLKGHACFCSRVAGQSRRDVYLRACQKDLRGYV